MLAFHQNWFWVAVISTGVVGAWGLVLGLLKRAAPQAFSFARWVAQFAKKITIWHAFSSR